MTSLPSTRHSCVFWLSEPKNLPYSIERKEFKGPHSFVIDRVDLGAGSDPMHEEGLYYCLDYTSVLTLSALQEVPFSPSVVLDMCASPGGKTVCGWKMFKGASGIVSNEVVSKRLPALISNIKRCHVQPSVVTCRDPSFFAEHFEGQVPVVIVDAPCSGQSLVASKGMPSGAFHPAVVQGNVKRQRRIVALSSKTVTSGGYLAYMTCTFAEKENEGVIEWFLRNNQDFCEVRVPHLEDYRSSRGTGYLCTPENGGGAGGFVALLKKTGEFEETPCTTHSFLGVWRNDVAKVDSGDCGERSTDERRKWKRDKGENRRDSSGHRRRNRS